MNNYENNQENAVTSFSTNGKAFSFHKLTNNAVGGGINGVEFFVERNKEEQTMESVMTLVQENGLFLKQVKEDLKTDQVVELALRQNGRAIAYVSNPTEAQRVLAVQTNPHAISEIKNKTKKVCLEAVKRNGLVLNYIQNQTKEVCLEAIRQNPIAMRFVRPGMYDKELFSIAVEKDWRLLEFVPKEMQDIEIAMVAYQQNPEAEKYFKF